MEEVLGLRIECLNCGATFLVNGQALAAEDAEGTGTAACLWLRQHRKLALGTGLAVLAGIVVIAGLLLVPRGGQARIAADGAPESGIVESGETGGGLDQSERRAFTAKRAWWICGGVEIETRPPMWFVRMQIGFRNKEVMERVAYGFTADSNGWDAHEKTGILAYQEFWDPAESLLKLGIPNHQLTAGPFANSLEQAIDFTVFRLDGEDSWTRLSDYVQVADDTPGRYTSRTCTRCFALIPIGADACENCGLRAAD